MMARTFSFLILVLLLPLSPADDLFAGLTEDPSDDAVAAENNEYLAPCGDQETQLPGYDIPPHGAPAPHATPLPTRAFCQGRLTESRALVRPGPDPVYVFMSLQR